MKLPEASPLRNKLLLCLKYRDYETAAFISMSLASAYPEFRLLTGIIFYENGEYSRALFQLANLNGTTAHFYKALCHKERKKYVESMAELTLIAEGNTVAELPEDPLIRSFLVDPADTEFFDGLLGKMMILKGKARLGIEKYRQVMAKSPLLGPCLGLIDENVGILQLADPLDPVSLLYQTVHRMSVQRQGVGSGPAVPQTINEIVTMFPEVKPYLSEVPGVGSYLLGKAASMYCRLTQSQVGLQLFEVLRDKDPCFIQEMDVYSTSLWINKDANLLGLLAKELISVAPNEYVTWSVIGNYYSLNGMPKESTTCLMKSLSIQENPFSYSLLGFEFNIRNQYTEAQNYFKSSLCMLENNDKANFGLGVAYSETSKRTVAEAYFKKALAINPSNMNMKAYFVRFYVKNDEKYKAVQKIREYLRLPCDSFDEMVSHIQERMGKFSEMEELIICELIEILVKERCRGMAVQLLSCVQLRTSTYFAKKCMVENEVL